MYLTTRPGYQVTPTAVYDGLVSELAVGDWLVGSRQKVVAVGATTGNPAVRTLTLARANAPTVDVSWLAASAIRFAR
jgi:hypothetical protein